MGLGHVEFDAINYQLMQKLYSGPCQYIKCILIMVLNYTN